MRPYRIHQISPWRFFVAVQGVPVASHEYPEHEPPVRSDVEVDAERMYETWRTSPR